MSDNGVEISGANGSDRGVVMVPAVEIAFSPGRVMLQVGGQAVVLTAGDAEKLGRFIVKTARKARRAVN